MYIAVNRTFTPDYFLKYSSSERVEDLDSIQHPIFREVLQSHSVDRGIEIASLADISAGTGLGSSGSFTVGLVRAIYALKREHVTSEQVAEEACDIEINRLKQPSGKQDQYIASFGGLSHFTFEPDGTVKAARLEVSSDTLCQLEENLLMFFTGYSRSSETILKDQKKRTETEDDEMIRNLHHTKQLGYATKDALERGDVDAYGEIMHEHWQHKRARSRGMSNQCIDHWYDTGRANGAIGGKLIGAGGGGFLLFLARDRQRLRRAMAAEGLEEVRFKFDHDGSVVMVRDR
jgi:D-glycero-alpha-D-manno-heptose-7-phosphate kinase